MTGVVVHLAAVGDAVADGQAEQADAVHRRPFRLAAAEGVAVAPAAVGVLAGLEAGGDQPHRPVHRHVVPLGGPQGEDGELRVGIVGGGVDDVGWLVRGVFQAELGHVLHDD